VDPWSFQFDGDGTALFHHHRRVRAVVNSTPVFGSVGESSYAGGVTTVVLQDTVDANGAYATLSAHPDSVAYSPLLAGAATNAPISFAEVLRMHGAQPRLRMEATDATGAAGEFALRVWDGGFDIQENTGAPTTPVWATRLGVTSAGIDAPALTLGGGNNALDFYEEGTFLPTIQGTATAGSNGYSSQHGKYTRIGNRVFVDGEITLVSLNSTGTLFISGMPFTVDSSGTYPIFLTVSNCSLPSGNVPIGYVNSLGRIVLSHQSSTGIGALTDADATGTMSITFNGVYQAS
jgi:hypothetical protein